MRAINTMGLENRNRDNFPQRPVTQLFPHPPPQAMSPFSSSGPVVGSETSGFQPGPSAVTQSPRPYAPAGPVNRPHISGFRPIYTDIHRDPSVPTSTSCGPPPVGTGQRYPTPQFSQTVQPFFPTSRPPHGQVSSSTAPFHPQPQIPSMPFQSHPQTMNHMQPGTNIPSQSMPGYPSNPTQPSPIGQPAPYGVPQGGYRMGMGPRIIAPRPFGQQNGYGIGPPTGTVQDVMADFSSLSLASVPGSGDAKLDLKALPRPLDGDVEPKAFADMFPMNCDPRYLRLTTSAIPSSQSLLSRWHLPLGAVVCPLAEAPEGEKVPIVDSTATGIIRCRRCRTYVNPYVTFTDGGRKWRCNICVLLNDVPGEYYAQLDANGRRVDLNERPELTKGSVEFLAASEYMLRPPMPPLYFFMIDVSVSAVRSGMLEVVAETIKSCLDTLPGFPRTQIGFITFDSTIHFYNIKASLTQPQMMVVSDLEDIFVPLPDDLLVNLSESRTVVDAFLDSLPSVFNDNLNVESAFGPALKAASMIVGQLGGKLLIFQNTIPSLGVGRLKLRGDDIRAYGTDKEHTFRIPEDPFYKQMAADCTQMQIAVNIYAFSDKYIDIASLGTLAKYTGGQLNHYANFHSAIHKEKLRHELARDLTRETAWESVMRIRCGKGVRFTSYHGNFMLKSTDLLALPAVDCDKAYAMQMILEETLLTSQTVYFQVALLYTSSSGERRIRVHTAAAPVVTDLGEMYRQADAGAIVSLLSRIAIEKSQSSKLEESRTTVQQRIVKSLREYRKLHASQNQLGRMIYPESLKFLPLYGLAICKSTPLRGGYADVQLDERCAAGLTMMTLPVKKMLKTLYPNLLRIDEFLVKASAKIHEFNISRLPLTAESLDSRGLYIYDDGFRFVIWFGSMSSPDLAMSLVGENLGADFSKNHLSLSIRDNEASRKLFTILNKFREADPSYYQLCHLVRQGEQPREGFFLLGNLFEDQVGGTNGYLDWIQQVHRQVQQNA